MTELELRAHRLAAIGTVENLMSRNAYYYAAHPNMAPPALPEEPSVPAASAPPEQVDMPVRCLASPVIEISPDGTQARGLWYSPGFSLHHDHREGRAAVEWRWEVCRGSFTYENGTWQLSEQAFQVDITAVEPYSWTE